MCNCTKLWYGVKPLAFAAETSDQISPVFREVLSGLDKALGPNFGGVRSAVHSSDRTSTICVIPGPGKPFCNRMMYSALQGLVQLWAPESEFPSPKTFRIPRPVAPGTEDPVGEMT